MWVGPMVPVTQSPSWNICRREGAELRQGHDGLRPVWRTVGRTLLQSHYLCLIYLLLSAFWPPSVQPYPQRANQITGFCILCISPLFIMLTVATSSIQRLNLHPSHTEIVIFLCLQNNSTNMHLSIFSKMPSPAAVPRVSLAFMCSQ